MLRLSTILLLSLTCLAAIVPGATATTMRPLSVGQLTGFSQSVVRATVLSSTPAWDARGRIVTTSRLRVLESLYGGAAPGSEIQVQTYGGVLDGVVFTAIGSPRFVPGQEVVAFLGRLATGATGVVGLAQGKFEVNREGPTGRALLTRRDLEAVDFTHGERAVVQMDLPALRDAVTRASSARNNH